MGAGSEQGEPRIRVERAFLELPTRAPDPRELARARAAMAGQPLEPEPTDPALAWPREILLWERERTASERVEVAAARIGDAALVTVPGEMFASLGMRIKEQSPLQPTLVIELGNGYHGYLPTAEAFAGGGYETRLARTSKLAPEAGPRIAEAAVALLKKLAE
jgi:hypothetical protein